MVQIGGVFLVMLWKSVRPVEHPLTCNLFPPKPFGGVPLQPGEGGSPRAACRSPPAPLRRCPRRFPRGVRGGSRRRLGESRGLPAEGPSPTRAAFAPPFFSSSSSSCCCCCCRRCCSAPLRLASPEPAAPALPLLPGLRSPGPAGGSWWALSTTSSSQSDPTAGSPGQPALRAELGCCQVLDSCTLRAEPRPVGLTAMLQCKHAQEFSFGPRALKDALISTNPALQELYAKAFSRAEKLFLSEAYNPQRTLFCTLLIRTAFDWLLSHPDAPEDFETFYHAMLRRKQSFCRKHIYLQPIDLTEGPTGPSLLDSLQSCVESFFLGLRVKCLPSIPISSIHCCYRHSQDTDRVQLHADGILNFLKNNKPMDALCVLGLTLLDLYPCETWSFTFSKFLPGQEVGVCSFARFSGDFPQASGSSLNPLTQKEQLSEVSKESRERTLPLSAQEMVQCCKVTCHEICHLMGLGTCRWLQCIMQGALSLDEALLRPLEPCPICLRKLQHVVGFKLVERYRKLYAWTQTVLSTWPRQEPADLSASEDILPLSSDSGMCCENDSEAVTSLSEPLTPDVCSQALSIGQELEQDERSCSPAEEQSQPQPAGPRQPTDVIKDYELWLETCIAALERNVSEEELARVDRAVDALARWDMFTGQLPAMKKDLPFVRDNTGLRKVLGDKFSSLRRKLSSRKLAKGESSPHRWRWEDN